MFRVNVQLVEEREGREGYLVVNRMRPLVRSRVRCLAIVMPFAGIDTIICPSSFDYLVLSC